MVEPDQKEKKEEEKGAKNTVLEAQQIAKKILGYNSSDPGRPTRVFYFFLVVRHWSLNLEKFTYRRSSYLVGT